MQAHRRFTRRDLTARDRRTEASVIQRFFPAERLPYIRPGFEVLRPEALAGNLYVDFRGELLLRGIQCPTKDRHRLPRASSQRC